MTTGAEITTLVTFAASWAVFSAGHNIADHVLGQNDWQAMNKGAPFPEEAAAGRNPHAGWAANLAHVGSYHLVLIVMGFLAWLVLPLHWSLWGIVAAVVWSAGTHALIDRRWPVRWLLEHTGSAGFVRLGKTGINGMYLADQALHGTAILISAVMLAVIP